MNRDSQPTVEAAFTDCCSQMDVTQIKDLLQKLQQILELFESKGEPQAQGILDLIQGENFRRILDLIQQIDVEKLVTVIQLINLIIGKFQSQGAASTNAVGQLVFESKKLRANLRAIGGLRELIKLVRELEEIMKCLNSIQT